MPDDEAPDGARGPLRDEPCGEPCGEVGDEVLEVTSPAQFKALAHQFRHRLLFALSHRPATTSQLAAALGAQKGNVAHHLKVLREAGMVRVVRTRQVRGGTEQYYTRAARRLEFAGNAAQPTAAMLAAVAQEIATAGGEPLLNLRHVRLSADQAEQLAATLAALVENAPDSDGEPRHGLLVGLYRPSGSAAPARGAKSGTG